MESLVFLSHKHAWGPNVIIRAHGLRLAEKEMIIMGPSQPGELQKNAIERWAKTIEAKSVAWIDDLDVNKSILKVIGIMFENGVSEAIIISEDARHESIADMIEGVEFVRAFEWRR